MSEGYHLLTVIQGSTITQAEHPTYCGLHSGQPLLMEVRGSRVKMSDVLGAGCGYLYDPHAPEVAGRLRAGEVLLAKAVGDCHCLFRDVLVWSEGEVVETEEAGEERPNEDQTPPLETIPEFEGWS